MPKKPVIKKKDPEQYTFHIEPEVASVQNEMYEKTLKNIHAMAVFTVKSYRRLGYQIKLQEQILEELKKRK